MLRSTNAFAVSAMFAAASRHPRPAREWATSSSGTGLLPADGSGLAGATKRRVPCRRGRVGVRGGSTHKVFIRLSRASMGEPTSNEPVAEIVDESKEEAFGNAGKSRRGCLSAWGTQSTS